MNFIKELSERWTQDSPAFFKKLQKFGAWLMGVGLGLFGVPATVEATMKVNFDLSFIATIAGYFFVIGLVLTVVAKLPNES